MIIANTIFKTRQRNFAGVIPFEIIGSRGWTTTPIGSIQLLEEPEHPQLWLCPSLSKIWEETQSLAEDLQEAALTLEISRDRDVEVSRLGALY